MSKRFTFSDIQKDTIYITAGSKNVICVRCTDSMSGETAAVVLNEKAVADLKEFLNNL